MANEFSFTAKVAYADSEGADFEFGIEQIAATIGTKRYLHAKQNVAITEEALNLGDVTTLGWFLGVNRDTTNFLSIKTGTGGTIFARLNPGLPALFRFGSGVTAPFVIADTATCQLEYALFMA